MMSQLWQQRTHHHGNHRRRLFHPSHPRTPNKGQCPIIWTVEVLRSCLRLTLAGTGLRQILSSNSARTTPSTAGRRFPAVSAYTSPQNGRLMSGPPSADHHLSRLVFYFKLAHLRMGIPRCSMAFFFNTRRDRRDSADERRPTALPRVSSSQRPRLSF